MENRLRRMLRRMMQTKDFSPDNRFEVKITDELVYFLAESCYKKTKAMGRMDKALDRKSQEIYDLEETTGVLLGALLDMTDVAKEVRDCLMVMDEGIDEKKMDAFCRQIDETEGLINDMSEELEGLDEAEEEEKDD